jgi:hypothetical protein
VSFTTIDQHHMGNIRESWYVRLYYDGETEYLGLSEQFGDDWQNHFAFLLRAPSIRESIDLAACKAKVSNVTLSLANATYRGAKLSAELAPGGTRKYINRKV